MPEGNLPSLFVSPYNVTERWTKTAVPFLQKPFLHQAIILSQHCDNNKKPCDVILLTFINHCDRGSLFHQTLATYLSKNAALTRQKTAFFTTNLSWKCQFVSRSSKLLTLEHKSVSLTVNIVTAFSLYRKVRHKCKQWDFHENRKMGSTGFHSRGQNDRGLA
jgi:hypothetical protein